MNTTEDTTPRAPRAAAGYNGRRLRVRSLNEIKVRSTDSTAALPPSQASA